MTSQRPPMTRKEALRLLCIRKDQPRREAAAKRRAEARAKAEEERRRMVLADIEMRVRLTTIYRDTYGFAWHAKVPHGFYKDGQGRFCANKADGFEIIPIPREVEDRSAGPMRNWVLHHLIAREGQSA